MTAGSNKIYTRTGDQGKTSLIGGARVDKHNLRLDVFGTVDELNSWLGLIACEMRTENSALTDDESKTTVAQIESIQNHLFDLGSRLACEDPKFRVQLPNVEKSDVAKLESEMDRYSARLSPLTNFVLPGGSKTASYCHIARTVCRRSERLCVKLREVDYDAVEDIVIEYINRLSDYLFILARAANMWASMPEPIWRPRSLS